MHYHAQLVVNPLVPRLVPKTLYANWWEDRQLKTFSDVFTEESREISALDRNLPLLFICSVWRGAEK